MVTPENKLLLKKLADTYENANFIADDPIQFAHHQGSHNSKEIVAFISSWLAYGKRSSIIQACETVFSEMKEYGPYMYIINRVWEKHKGSKKNLYRFYRWGDFADLCEKMYDIYSNYENMEYCFKDFHPKSGNILDNVYTLIIMFRGVKGIPQDTSSPCKRLNLFLRWVTRGGEVDLGIWNATKAEDLIIPFDTHVKNVAKKLGLIPNNNENMATAIELTNICKEVFQDDPCRADFALFGYGVSGNINNEEESYE